MTEISGIQLLLTGLIVVLFCMVFMIIQANWSFKAMQHQEAADEAESIPVPIFTGLELPRLPEIAVREEKEIKLVPRMLIKEEPMPAAIPASREFAFVKEADEELEPVFALGKAQ
jgi:hypothetical protein